MLIADCGSSKIHWCLLTSGGGKTEFFTPGMNALLTPPREMLLRFQQELLPELADAAAVDKVYFYGAGCVSDAVCADVERALSEVLPYAVIEVNTDLLAAARALCGRKPGIACILGTGSNSCLYDGDRIVDNVSPLGYILGDEGSGAVLGKLLVGDVLKRRLPSDLCESFLETYSLDRITIINKVYREPGANKFLSSLSPFLARNIGRQEIRALVRGAFEAFFRRNITSYAGYRYLPCNFVGSVAWHYSEVLAEAAKREGCMLGKIYKSPVDGLVAYHTDGK